MRADEVLALKRLFVSTDTVIVVRVSVLSWLLLIWGSDDVVSSKVSKIH